jgi:2-iminobutanoate/2-iminopropanoate deaminase
MKIINTNKAPQPLGHYSQAIEHNGLIFVSGQLPIDPKNPNKPIGSIEEQTTLTLKNIEAILAAANSNKSQILKTTIYISDISLWSRANDAYSEFFGEHKPARAAVPTKDLPKGYQIEIEAIASNKE